MRLGTCIALELAVAAGAASGIVLGVGRAIDSAGDFLGEPEAAAATSHGRAPEALPAARLAIHQAEPPGTVFDLPDDELLAPLGAAPVTRIKLNHGGTSLSLRVDFANGARAAFKPQQTHPQSDPKREIAAYRVDRLLGIGHVPPAKPIALPVDELVAAADADVRTYTEGRIRDEAIIRGGIVRGELSWWIPEIRDVTLGGFHIDERDGEDVWRGYLQAGAAIPDDVRPMLAQISTCILFDVLIDNADRWTGNNTKGSVDRKTLYFMDNTLAFQLVSIGHEENLTPFYKIQVFPRALVAKLRTLTYEDLDAALALGDDSAGMSPLLEPAEIRAILSRRDHMLRYIDSLIADHGEDQVLALP